jgi:hypothetical protein
MSDRGLTPRALRDIKSAAHAGRFRFADPELALTLAAGVLLGLAQLLHDEPERDAAEASDLLGIYGIPADEAEKNLPALTS